MTVTSILHGKLSHPLTYSIGNHSLLSSLATGDFNHDNYLDIVIVNAAADNIGVLFGHGN